MPFLTDLSVTLLPGEFEDGRPLWRLNAPLVYVSRKTGKEYRAEQGAKINFVSVRRWIILFWLFADRAHRESALHDDLYRTGAVPREEADAVFHEAMEESDEEPGGIRALMWGGVRLFGGSHYKKQAGRRETQNRPEDFYVG